MRELIQKVISGFVVLIYCLTLIPAQEFSNLAAGKQRLDFYLDKAGQENLENNWLEVAEEGIISAMELWENENAYLKDIDSGEYETLKKNARIYYETLKTEKYVDWIVNYFAREQKAQSFAELKKQIQNEITTFDVSSYSLSEASVLFNDLDKSTKEITQKYIENFDINNGFYYSELSVRLAETGLSDDQKERLIQEMSENVNESLSAESEMLSEKEGSRFLLRFLKDENSLRAKNAGEAASIVAKDLAENAYKETSEEMEILFSQLKKDIESSGTNEVSSESILEQFQNVMKRGLAKWEEAELEFLTDRADWEKNAGLVYQQGNEIWDAAFAELQLKKVEWQKNISEKLREVELAAEQKSDDFQKEIENIYTAYAQQLNNSQQIQLQIVNTLETVNYTLRDAIATSREGIDSWYNIWGEKYNGVYSYWKTEDALRNQFVKETPNGNSIITVDVYNSGNDLEQVQEIIETYLEKEQQMLIKIYKDTTDKYHSEIEQSQKKLNNLIETYAEREEIKVSNSSFYGSTVDYEHVLFNWETGFTSEYEEKAFRYFENGLNEYFLDTDEDTVDEEEVNYYTTLYKSYIDSYKDNISKYKALINQKDDFIEKIESLTNQAKETYQTDTAGSVFNELEKFVTDTKETTALSDNETFEYHAAKHRAFTSLVNWYKQLNEYKNLYEENIKSFEALKNQNSENEVQNPELELQLQKAKLNRDYFEEQYQIAKAVNDYAEISDAGRESQKTTEDNLTEAGRNYAEQLRKYNEAVRELENYEKALKAAGDVIVKAEEKIKDVQTAISQKQMEYESIMAAQNNLDIKLTAELLRREIESLDAVFDTQDESSNQISAELKKNRNEEYQSYRQIEAAVLNEYKAYASEIQNASTCLASAERGAYFESLDKISVKFAEEENLNFWYLNILNLANECDSLFKEESPILSESLKNFYEERYITQINAYFELMAKYSREVQNGISDNKKHEDSISVKDADYLSFIKEVLLLDAENNSEVIDLINEYETADTEIKQALIAGWNKENRTDILSIVKGTYEIADDSLSAAFNALKSENTGLTRLWKEFSDNVSAYYEYGNSYNAELFIGKFETNDAKIKAALSKLDSCHDYTEIINGLMEVTQVMESLKLSKTTSMAASYYLDAFMQREALNYVENTSNRSIIKNHYNELTEIAPSENADESDELEEIKKNTVLRSDIEIQFLKYAITEIDSDKYSWIEKLNNCGFTDSEIFASKDSKNKFKELLNGFNEKIHKYKDNYAKTFLSYFNEAQPVTEEQSDEVQVSESLDELLAVIKVQYEIYNQKTNQDKIKENANTVLQAIEKLEAELNEKKKTYDEAVINYTNAGTSYNEYVQNLENQYLKLEEYRLEKRKAQAVKDWAESIYLNNIGQSYDDSYVTPKEVLAQAEYAFKVADLSYNMLEELISQGTASSKLPWQKDRDKYTASEKNYYNSLI